MIRNLYLILFFLNLSFVSAQKRIDHYKIIDQFRRYELDSIDKQINALPESTSKDILKLELRYQISGEINRNDIDCIKSKSKEHYLDSVLYYNFLGDFYLRKSKIEKIDYIKAFSNYEKSLEISKRHNHQELIMESLRRINHFFLLNPTDENLNKHFVNEIRLFSRDNVDIFWSKYYKEFYNMTQKAISKGALKSHEKRFSEKDFTNLKKESEKLIFLAKGNSYFMGISLHYKSMLLLENKDALNEALDYIKQALEYHNQNNLYYSKQRKERTFTLLANHTYKNNNYKKAVDLLHQILKNNQNEIEIGFKKSIYSNLYKVYKEQKIVDSLSYYLELFTITNNEEKQEFAAVEIRKIYEKNNSQEYQRKLKKQEKEIMNQTTILSIVLPILAIIALIAIALFYYFKKYKSKSKNLESAQSETLEKIEELKSIVIKNHIVLKDKTKVYISDLMYIKSEDHYLRIFTNDTKSAFVRGKLSQIKEELPPNFIQSHRSYIINSNFIKQINNNHIILLDKTEIPLSRSHKNNFKDKP
ncbi:LytTR family transcriptional regulator DNA-binding domain-containing protein [Kordia sp.]|uniref:LytTR family transcriptional regulator DNA-binding domain-containing protein n=1 Tax=Kordia sp. TaxID=1965332 RepID=UPI003D6A96F7